MSVWDFVAIFFTALGLLAAGIALTAWSVNASIRRERERAGG